MEFKLTIRLGNDAMRSGSDVASALRALSEAVAVAWDDEKDAPGSCGRLRDENGNTVGRWEVMPD